CRGQTTRDVSWSQSPSHRGPSSCEQRSSIAYSEPAQLYTPTVSAGPATTSFTEPGGNSSAAATSICAINLGELELVEPREPVGKGRALRLVQGDLQRRQPEQRALEAPRRERDGDLVEELLLVERRDVRRRLPGDHLHQHRRRRLRDRAAAAGELDLVDR